MTRTLLNVICAMMLALLLPSAQAAGESDVVRAIRESGRTEKFAETLYVDHSAPPAPLPAEQDRGYIVFRRHWMDLVFPNSIPAREEVADSLAVFASPAEYEPVTFCLRSLRPLKGVRVKAGELVSAAEQRLDAPEVRRVRLVPKMWQGERPLYPDGPIGIMNMPAYLEDCASVDLPAEMTVQYWLTVKVPEGTSPGEYAGDVEIRTDGNGDHRLRLVVRVLPITLADPPTRMGFWDYYADEYQGEMGPMDEVYRDMRENGVNSLIVKGTRVIKRDHLSLDEEGNVHLKIDGSLLEHVMGTCKRLGFRTVMPWQVSGYFLWALEVTQERLDDQTRERQEAEGVAEMKSRFKNSDAYAEIEEEIDKANDRYPGLFTKEFARVFGQAIQALIEEADRRAWPEMYLTTCDETPSHHAHDQTTWLFTIHLLEIMKHAGAKTILQMGLATKAGKHAAYSKAALPLVDVAMPVPLFVPNSNWYYKGVLADHVKAFQAAKKRVFVYNHHQGKIPDPTTTRFIGSYFVHTMAKGVEGMFTYVFYRNAGNPYNPVDARYWASEQFWIYPALPEEGRSGGPSISCEALREGWDDHRYLHTLTTLIQEARERTDSPQAKMAASAATKVRSRILDSLDLKAVLEQVQPRGIWDTVKAPTDGQSTVEGSLRLRTGWDFEDYDRARWELAQEILKLQAL